MEELLPILIGLIWLAYSFYNKNQKKKRSNQPASSKSGEVGSPSILEQLLSQSEASDEDTYEPYYQDEESDSVIMKKTEHISSVIKPEPFLEAELPEFIDEGLLAEDESEENEIYEKSESVNIFDDFGEFDLRKAVIFSEILNAPYIEYK